MMKTTKRNVILKVKFDYDNSRSLQHINLLIYDTTKFDKKPKSNSKQILGIREIIFLGYTGTQTPLRVSSLDTTTLIFAN